MRTWTADAITTGHPAQVLDVLTDPHAISRWAPIPFEVEGLDSDRLEPGTRARVVGKLAGFGVAFDVEVNEAGEDGLSLVADGPIGIDVDYQLRPHATGSAVRAAVSVRPGSGLRGRLLAQATEALLAGGALAQAVGRIARDVNSGTPELALAA
jgi:hypothetical protein